MRTLILLCFVFIYNLNFSQSKYITRTGTVAFEASVPSFEEVKAKNETTTCIINTDTGNIAALVFVKAFRFKNALMEEHFNENYIESNTYPKMTFKGSIDNFNVLLLSEKNSNMTITGDLTLHGKTSKVSIDEAKMSMQNNIISISGSFNVKPSDFDIKIPKVVSKKISNRIDIIFEFKLEKQ